MVGLRGGWRCDGHLGSHMQASQPAYIAQCCRHVGIPTEAPSRSPIAAAHYDVCSNLKIIFLLHTMYPPPPWRRATLSRITTNRTTEKYASVQSLCCDINGKPCKCILWYREKIEGERLVLFSTREWRQLHGLLQPFAIRICNAWD